MLSERLTMLGYETYAHYLASDRWQRMRRERLGQRPRCHVCRGRRVELHHVDYSRLGAELPTDLVELCRRCHERVHELVMTEGVPLATAHEELKRRQAAKRRAPLPVKDARAKWERLDAKQHRADRDARRKARAAVRKGRDDGLDLIA